MRSWQEVSSEEGTGSCLKGNVPCLLRCIIILIVKDALIRRVELSRSIHASAGLRAGLRSGARVPAVPLSSSPWYGLFSLNTKSLFTNESEALRVSRGQTRWKPEPGRLQWWCEVSRRGHACSPEMFCAALKSHVPVR